MVGPSSASGWLVRPEGDQSVLVLRSDWTAIDATSAAQRAAIALERTGLRSIAYDTSEISRWDSSLLVFVSSIRHAAALYCIRVDESGLPDAARGLLTLLTVVTPAAIASTPAGSLTERIGRWAIARALGWVANATLVGEQILSAGEWLRGRAKVRRSDLVTYLHDAGIGALPMVALVNLMVGAMAVIRGAISRTMPTPTSGILAFVGVVQLRRFGASIYVADLCAGHHFRRVGAGSAFHPDARQDDKLAAASQLQITANGDQLQQLLDSARRTTAEADQLIASLNELAAPRSAMRGDLEATLRDLAATSSSLRLFTHDLERDPARTLLRRSAP